MMKLSMLDKIFDDAYDRTCVTKTRPRVCRIHSKNTHNPSTVRIEVAIQDNQKDALGHLLSAVQPPVL